MVDCRQLGALFMTRAAGKSSFQGDGGVTGAHQVLIALLVAEFNTERVPVSVTGFVGLYSRFHKFPLNRISLVKTVHRFHGIVGHQFLLIRRSGQGVSDRFAWKYTCKRTYRRSASLRSSRRIRRTIN